MDKLIEPDTLAELLGVSIYDLKNWRRLPDTHPRHIKSTIVGCRHKFASSDVIDFLKRNADMAERVAGLFAPPVLTLALKGYAHPAADHVPPADYSWWLSHTEQTPQTPQTQKENT